MVKDSLKNVFNILNLSLRGFYVNVGRPPSYLKIISNSDKEIIFVCKEDFSMGDDSPKKNHIKNSRLNDLDLTGSPLKDDIKLEELEIGLDFTSAMDYFPWSNKETFFKPLTLNKVRSIFSDLNLQKSGRENGNTGNVWILCDASDHHKTIFLNLGFEKSFNCSGYIRFCGLIPSKALDSVQLIKKHCELTKDSNPKIETDLYSYFNIKPNIILKLDWTTSAKKIDLNNYKNYDAHLYQTLNLNNDSAAQEFWDQIRLLNSIKKDIVSYKSNSGDSFKTEIEYTKGSEINIEDLKIEIVQSMTEISACCAIENYDDNIEEVISNLKSRSSIDLTDKLWNILKRCASYRDLKTAFNFLFQCAAQKNIVNLPTNHNYLAEIIRELSQHRLAIPYLSGSEPLELLLEIGLEKLWKDYEYVFTESKICSGNDLRITSKRISGTLDSDLSVRNTLHNAMKNMNHKERKTLLHMKNSSCLDKSEIIGFQNSKFNQQETDNELNKLLQVHLTLEHLMSIQNHLNLENVNAQFCSQILKRECYSFDEFEEENCDRIELPIMMDKILRHVENKDPNSRQIIMSSKNKFREIRSIHYFNMDNIFPPNTFNNIKIEDNFLSSDNKYFHWNYCQIKSKRS